MCTKAILNLRRSAEVFHNNGFDLCCVNTRPINMSTLLTVYLSGSVFTQPIKFKNYLLQLIKSQTNFIYLPVVRIAHETG